MQFETQEELIEILKLKERVAELRRLLMLAKPYIPDQRQELHAQIHRAIEQT